MLFGWVILIGVVAAIVWLFRSASGATRGSAAAATPEPRTRARASAMQILEERFARGEIDKQEFEERREELLRSRRSAA